MGNLKVFDNMIENKLLNLHTAYLAKVISSNGKTAKIQPLGMVRAIGESAKKQSPLANVPIATQRFVERTVNVGDGQTITVPQEKPIAAGDIVVCICCERNITEAKKGKNVVPPIGHHSMSDSIIIGVL